VQRQGIEKLSAFLSNSEIMVALYTDTYLLKLWTVYEVASFLALRPIKCMKIVPVYQLFAYHNGLLVGYLNQMSTIVLRSYTTFAWHELILWNGVFGLKTGVLQYRNITSGENIGAHKTIFGEGLDRSVRYESNSCLVTYFRAF